MLQPTSSATQTNWQLHTAKAFMVTSIVVGILALVAAGCVLYPGAVHQHVWSVLKYSLICGGTLWVALLGAFFLLDKRKPHEGPPPPNYPSFSTKDVDLHKGSTFTTQTFDFTWQTEGLLTLPRELLKEIALLLHGKDLLHFTSASKGCRSLLKEQGIEPRLALELLFLKNQSALEEACSTNSDLKSLFHPAVLTLIHDLFEETNLLPSVEIDHAMNTLVETKDLVKTEDLKLINTYASLLCMPEKGPVSFTFGSVIPGSWKERSRINITLQCRSDQNESIKAWINIGVFPAMEKIRLEISWDAGSGSGSNLKDTDWVLDKPSTIQTPAQSASDMRGLLELNSPPLPTLKQLLRGDEIEVKADFMNQTTGNVKIHLDSIVD